MSTREVWDRIYQKFEGFNKLDNIFYTRLIEIIAKYANDSQSVLEVGSGSGYLVSFFQKHLFSVGLDRSVTPLKVAKTQFGAKNLILGDMFHLPFRDNSFDIVWNEGVIEHFIEPKNLQACKEMKRVSRKYVIVAVPNKNPIWLIRKVVLRIINKWPYGYEESYSVQRLRKMMCQTGLKVEDILGIRILPPVKEAKRFRDLLALFTFTLPLSSKNITKLVNDSLSIENNHRTLAKIFGYAIIGIGRK